MSSSNGNSKRRTDELLESGAKELDGQQKAPFVRWPEVYAYVEGRVLQIWEGTYGLVCRLRLERASENVEVVSGKDSDQTDQRLQPGMEVNLGLSYAGLKTIDDERVGKRLHVAFEHWGETRDGNRFRSFRVLELPGDNDVESEVESAPDEPSDPQEQLSL